MEARSVPKRMEAYMARVRMSHFLVTAAGSYRYPESICKAPYVSISENETAADGYLHQPPLQNRSVRDGVEAILTVIS